MGLPEAGSLALQPSGMSMDGFEGSDFPACSPLPFLPLPLPFPVPFGGVYGANLPGLG